jgi:hypothetical protein
MSASLPAQAAFLGRLPKPTELLIRVAAAAALVIYLGSVGGAATARTLLPTIRIAFQVIEHDFVILDLAVTNESTHDVLRCRADFSHPTQINGYRLTPLGNFPGEEGWHEVRLTLGGVLQGAMVVFVVLLAWPATIRSAAVRLLIGVPACVLATSLDAAASLQANLWIPVIEEWNPNGVWPSVIVTKVLDGGGRFALALVLAVGIIAAASGIRRKFAR